MNDDFEFEEAPPAESSQQPDQFSPEDFPAQPSSEQPDLTIDPPEQFSTPLVSSNSPATPPAVHIESSAQTAFKAKQAQHVQALDAQHAAKKKEMAKVAEAYLEKFKAERQKKIAATAQKNREQPKHASAATTFKVSQLLDLDKATTDRERMRALLKAA